MKETKHLPEFIKVRWGRGLLIFRKREFIRARNRGFNFIRNKRVKAYEKKTKEEAPLWTIQST